MKKIVFAVAVLLSWLISARAQVTAEIVMEQEYFLIGETLPVAVRITNRSGQTLRMGTDQDWLTFALESRTGTLVAKNGEVPVEGEFELASGKTATRRVNLSPYFALNRVGRFQLSANVRIKEWDASIATRPKSFEIINAAKIWYQDFGMPQQPGVTNQVPEVRRYTLEKANYLRGKQRLYLRLTDAPGTQVFKIVHIGGMVSLSDPAAQIDRQNQLHVLYQFGARHYLYTMISPDGEIVIRQTHEITSNRPRLQPDETGGFHVAGGERRFSETDLPVVNQVNHDAPSDTP
jgi:hypothetical protein